MKKLILFLLIINLHVLHAQVEEKGIPFSFKSGIHLGFNNAVYSFSPDTALYKKSQETNYSRNSRFSLKSAKIGTILPVNLSMENAGKWKYFQNGDKIWYLKIHVRNAYAIGLYYDDYQVNNNGHLYLYNENRSEVLGAFSSKNNDSSKSFVTGVIKDNTIIIEYHEKAGIL